VLFCNTNVFYSAIIRNKIHTRSPSPSLTDRCRDGVRDYRRSIVTDADRRTSVVETVASAVVVEK